MNPSFFCISFILALVSFPVQIRSKGFVKKEVKKEEETDKISVGTAERLDDWKMQKDNPKDMNSDVSDEDLDNREVVVGHGHMNCTLMDYFCNPSAADLVEKIEEKEVHSAKECHDICMDEEGCSFFTFLKFRGSPSCYILKSCNEKKPMCTVPGTCLSGEKNCKDDEHCPKLKLKKGDHTRWRCEGINPYKEDIPSYTACHTSCPDWSNAAGSTVTAKSTCQSNGTWSEPIPFPPGPLSFPSVLNKPDGPDMLCGGCSPLNITYNPNLEKGAEFFCNPPVSWKKLPLKIVQGTQCHLLCDKMLVAITECNKDIWTGNPEMGFWCTEEKAPVGHWVEK